MRYLVVVTSIAIVLLAVGFFVTESSSADQLSYTGTLEAGDTTFDDTGEFFDTYEIKLEAGQFVDLYLSSEAFNTYLFIVLPDGEEVQVDDYYTDDLNAGLLFIARETGIYTFYVTSSAAGETGDYKFSCTTTQTKLDKTFAGELAEDDEVSWKGGEYFDRYELELKPFEKRVLTLDSDDFSVHLSMHWPNGYVDYVFGYPAATLLEADENGGTYTLIVTSSEAKEVDTYSLEVRQLIEEQADANEGGSDAASPKEE